MKVALSAALWFAIGACFGVALAPEVARAEGPSAQRAERASAAKKQRPKRVRQKPRIEQDRAARRMARAARRERARRGAAASPAPSSAPREAARGDGAEIVREGDTSVKVMHFSGLDIEGRLKSPQLLVFVERVRAEFERPALPHRSFLPELRDTAAREPVR